MLEPQILKPGDESGNRMIVKYTHPESPSPVWALGIPQAWETPLGPTWCYVIEEERLTVIDPGCHGSERYLAEGLAYLGYSLDAVQRMVVTHGHLDHDGGCLHLAQAGGAELWAHEVYASLLLPDRWERETGWRRQLSGFREFQDSDTVARVKEHHRRALELPPVYKVTDGQCAGGLTYYHTPGHSPDELCIQFQNYLFTGDHVLPQITPHPSTARSYANFRANLPESHQGANRIYGLTAMLRSLYRVANLDHGQAVLPAHRAYYRGQFNPVRLSARANEIINHHISRCYGLIEILKSGPRDMASLTGDHFAQRELSGGNFFLALTEVVSHVELLIETGDVAMDGGPGGGEYGGLVHWNGTESFPDFIRGLGAEFAAPPVP